MQESFMEAIRAADLARVRALLQQKPELARTVEPQRGTTTLHLAIHTGKPEIVEALVAAGADLNARAADGRTPLHDAIEYGHRPMEKLLIASGAEIDICAAAILGMQDHVRAHLERDPQLANDRSSNLSPLGWASFGNQSEVARMLIQQGARMDDGELLCAASCGHVDVARVLLEHGADPNRIEPHTGGTALHTAACMRYSEDTSAIVSLLLASGADPSVPSRDGKTALEMAEELERRQAERGPKGFPRKYENVVKLLREATRQL